MVLVDALRPLGKGRVLPAGTLREPARTLARADVVMLTRVDLAAAPDLAELRRQARHLAPQALLVEAIHRPLALAPAGEAPPRDLAWLAGRRVHLFCGIGNPRAFLLTVQALGAEVAAARFLPDHFRFQERDLRDLAAECERSGAELALTTEKDAVKIGPAWPGSIPLYALRVEMEVVVGGEELQARLKSVLSSWG